MPPKVSILLPNLNHRPYLEERLQTIQDQTFTDWELIIVDSYSGDGSWKLFQDCARKDPRIRIYQRPQEGIYSGWNSCIRQARGEYIYIAPSDDTMSPRFFETMVKALDTYTDCGLAHCKLTIINETGSVHPSVNWELLPGVAFFGSLINQKHIRLAPHDGLLYCGLYTVYTSITQLLIRKSLFDRVGLFRMDFGAIADFEWGMRAALVTNTIHIPEYLASWRVHQTQKTDFQFFDTNEFRGQLIEMIDRAFEGAFRVEPERLKKIRNKNLKFLYQIEQLQIELTKSKRGIARSKVILKWFLSRPEILWFLHHFSKTMRDESLSINRRFEFCRKLLMRYGAEHNIILLKE